MIKSIDDTWSSDLLDMNDSDPKIKKSYRYNLLVIDIFSKFGWIFPLKNIYVQSILDAFSQIIKHRNINQNSSKQMMERSISKNFFIEVLDKKYI